jgi:chemotaxis protein histidine kinase CheA
MGSLDAIIDQLRWAAARARAARYAVHGLVGAVAWVAVILIIARLTPMERRAEVAAIGIPAAIAIAALAWLLRRPSAAVLMRLADLRLGLKERLSTAWERRAESGPMDDVQRQDALRQAATARLAAAFPVRVNRGEASLVAVLAIFSLALALLPNPMDQVLAQRQADRTSQARAAKAIQDAQKKVADSTKPTPVDPQVQKILQDAQAKIRQADSPRKALESITPAEQQLQRLPDPGTPALSSSAQNLANALSATSAGRSAAQAISSSPAQGAQSVRDLASQLQNLSPKDRQELAQALAKASQQAQNSQMRDSLSKASSSLQSGDTTSAAQALDSVASQLDSLQQQQNTDQAVASAINGLEAARQELATQADRDASGQGAQANANASASPGTSPGSGAGAGASASGSGSGNGTGNGNGDGNGNGNGNGNGSGGAGSGSGGSSGSGSNGSGTGSGSGAAGTERVYVPGQPVPGQSQNDPAPLGPGQDVPLSPYSQVIQAYQQAALDATDQSLIPGSERDLVRQYFSQLGEQSAAGPK